MIALIKFTSSVRPPWILELDTLPHPPALACDGFLINCVPPPDDVIPWFLEMREVQKHTPIGAVVRSNDPFLYSAVEAGVQFRPLLRASEVVDGSVPKSALNYVQRKALVGRLLKAWAADVQGARGDAVEIDDLLASAAAVGMNGGGTAALCRLLGHKRSTVYRRYERAGLPPPAHLLRRARLESVPIRLELGMDPVTAREAAGWFTPRAYEKARYRHRHHGTDWGGQ
jgi:hypothetical protein